MTKRLHSVNGRLQRVEGLAAALFDPAPEYSGDQLRTWHTCIEIAVLVADQYDRDRGSAIGDLENWPPDLFGRCNAFTWQLNTFLGPLFPGVESEHWQSVIASALDYLVIQPDIDLALLRTSDGLTEFLDICHQILEGEKC